MAGAGTGQPIVFRCTRCKVRRDWRSHDRAGTNVVRTGATKPYKGHQGGARVLRVFHEYRCLDCGHVGWSRHVDIARKPLAAAVPRPSNYGKGATRY